MIYTIKGLNVNNTPNYTLVVKVLVIVLAAYSLILRAVLFRLQLGIRGVPRHIAVMMGASANNIMNPARAYRLFWFDIFLQIIVSVLLLVIFNWMWALGFVVFYFLGTPILSGILSLIFERNKTNTRRISTYELILNFWEQKYKNNYAIIVDKISYGITSGGTKVALLEKELVDLLNSARENPNKETYLRLRKWLIENEPKNSVGSNSQPADSEKNYPNYKGGYTEEEFTASLKKALGSFGTTVKRKTVLPEDTNKFLVKFIKKKPEDKSKE